MKWLILGACGMAGHLIAKYLSEQKETVTGFARQKSSVCDTIIGDAFNNYLLENLIKTGNFDIAVNCIGVLNKAVDANLANGIYLNSYLPHKLAIYCQKYNTKLIHISTDCVFSGKRGHYTENEVPDETSYYGRTKALGEVIYNNHLTIRTSIIGPELKENGIGLFHWFMNQNEKVDGYTKVLWSGVTTLELAKAVFFGAKNNLSGLWHLSNNESIAKYDLLRLFNKYFKADKLKIEPCDVPISDKSIIFTRKDFAYNTPNYEEMIADMAMWIKNHKELYKQYFKIVEL